MSESKLPMAKVEDGRPFPRSGVAALPIRWRHVAIATALTLAACAGAWMWAWDKILHG